MVCGCQQKNPQVTTPITTPNVEFDRRYPQTNYLAKYSEFSDIDYPIYNGADVPKGWLWFDDYAVGRFADGNYAVAIRGYWYVDGGKWKKCDGDFEFKTSELFTPVPLKKVEFEVIRQSCGGK
jgi:hypothetical protein